MPRPIGKVLNERWRVGARHALYHKDGKWYHPLNDFPGALFDPNGYVLFRSEEEFRSCSRLKIGQAVNVVGHISQIYGYIRMPDDQVYRGE